MAMFAYLPTLDELDAYASGEREVDDSSGGAAEESGDVAPRDPRWGDSLQDTGGVALVGSDVVVIVSHSGLVADPPSVVTVKVAGDLGVRYRSEVGKFSHDVE